MDEELYEEIIVDYGLCSSKFVLVNLTIIDYSWCLEEKSDKGEERVFDSPYPFGTQFIDMNKLGNSARLKPQGLDNIRFQILFSNDGIFDCLKENSLCEVREVMNYILSLDNNDKKDNLHRLTWLMGSLVTFNLIDRSTVVLVYDTNNPVSIYLADIILSHILKYILSDNTCMVETGEINQDDPLVAADHLMQYSLFHPNIYLLLIVSPIDMQNYRNDLNFCEWCSLEILSIDECPSFPSDLNVFTKFNQLKSLEIRYSPGITDEFIASIKWNCRLLEFVRITGCLNVSEDAMKSLFCRGQSSLKQIAIVIFHIPFTADLFQSIIMNHDINHIEVTASTCLDHIPFHYLEKLPLLETLILNFNFPNEMQLNSFWGISSCKFKALTELEIQTNAMNYSKELLKNIILNIPFLKRLNLGSSAPDFIFNQGTLIPLYHANLSELVLIFYWRKDFDEMKEANVHHCLISNDSILLRSTSYASVTISRHIAIDNMEENQHLEVSIKKKKKYVDILCIYENILKILV